MRRHKTRMPFGKGEEGQSIAEMAITFPFLLLLLIAVIELAQAFTVYVVLVSAARAGAVWASTHPELSTEPNMITNESGWVGATCSAANYDNCAKYSDRVKAEMTGFDAFGLEVEAMVYWLSPTVTSSNHMGNNCPITSTVSYDLTTFTSSMSLPLVERFGLPSSYHLQYSVSMPIRDQATFDPDSCP